MDPGPPSDEPSPPSGTTSPIAERAHSRRQRRKQRRAERSKLRRRLTRTGIGVAALIVIVLGAAGGYYWYRSNQVTSSPAPHESTALGKGGTENILLIGSTSRCAAAQLAQFRAQCNAGVTGVNSDVVLVARLDPANDTVSLLSIPRDTFVPDARAGGLYNKIDAALYNGPDQLIAAIEQDFGIPINHYVDLNFDTFEEVVNALGGIHMYFPDRLYDASSGLNIKSTGCLYLNGNQALELVRSRHLYYFTKTQTINYGAIQAANTPEGPWYTPDSGGTYDGTGDLGRIIRVHLFLKALASQVTKHGLGNLLTDNALIGAIAPNLHVDTGFSTFSMAKLAFDFRHANVNAAPELTLPTVTDAQTYYYKGYSYGDVIFPTEPQDQQTVDQFLGEKPSWLSLPPASISVSVVDGTDSASETQAVSENLGALGYKMVPTSATDYVGPVSETSVVYRAGATATATQHNLEEAQRVMSSLQGTVVLAEGTPSSGADVSVVTGSDLTVARPSAPPTSTSSPSATTTTVPPVTTTTNPNLGQPTSATAAIPFYDPRSCPGS